MRSIHGFEVPRVLGPVVARRLGLTRARIRTEVRRGNWQRLASGIVLTRPDPPTRCDWADVGLELAGASAALSGWDALRVCGLGAPVPPDPNVLVLTRRGANRVVGSVRIRRTTRPFEQSVVSVCHPDLPLIPIVSVARAVADTALVLTDLPAARALVTSAVQRRACALRDIVAELDASPRNRSRLLRLALGDAILGARSAAEAEAASKLVRAVPPFELNVPIVDEHGVALFVVDVLWRELRAALEIDSREFHFTEAGWLATLDRHNELTACGLALLHYPPSAVTRRGSGFTAEVAEWLRRRAVELGVPLPRGHGVIAPVLGAAPAAYVVTRGRQR